MCRLKPACRPSWLTCNAGNILSKGGGRDGHTGAGAALHAQLSEHNFCVAGNLQCRKDVRDCLWRDMQVQQMR